MRFNEIPDKHLPPAVSKSSSSSSRPYPNLPRGRSDDTVEHSGSKKVKLSEHCTLPREARTSAHVDLSSCGMSVEFSAGATWTGTCCKQTEARGAEQDCWRDQFLEVAELDQSARGRTTHDPLKLKQSVKVIHVVVIFSQTKTMASWHLDWSSTGYAAAGGLHVRTTTERL